MSNVRNQIRLEVEFDGCPFDGVSEMSELSLRSLGLLLTVVVSSADKAIGTDHWGSHLQRHTCHGNCGLPNQMTSRDHLGTGGVMESGAAGVTSLSTDESEGTHLFLSVSSVDGVKNFSSGVVRSGKIEYGPLAFEMNSTSGEMPTEFRMLLDGEAAHPETFEAGSEWQGTEQGWSRSVQWKCPPLGRHSVQFEVRLNDRLVTSEQLWIEIVAPRKPEVVAVGSSEIGTSPIESGKVVTVYKDTMVVRFAMPAAAEMIMHRPGMEDFKVEAIDECCFVFDLKDLSVGRHGLKFSRVVGTGCAMTSEPSDTLWIQYEPTQALHSLRNENANRRRAIVDEIRRISASSRPAFGGSNMYSSVNSKFAPLSFNSGLTPSENVHESSMVAEQLAAPSAEVTIDSGESLSTGTPKLTPHITLEPSEEPIAEPKPELAPTLPPSIDNTPQTQKDNTTVPEPKTSRTKSSSTRFIASSNNNQSIETSFLQTEIGPLAKDEPSKLLRERAQLDADQLSKFEDDLALTESIWQANKVVSHVIFDAPAYFTQNGYGTSGEEDARNGLVLLEGMELSTQASGHWELKIPYIRSATPAVLHLQIQFKAADGHWKPLTLQPVCFKAGRPCIDLSDCNCDHSGVTSSDQSVRCSCSESGQPMVTLSGYSPILRREVGVFTDVRRRGSAVFGHGYSALEDRRSF